MSLNFLVFAVLIIGVAASISYGFTPIVDTSLGSIAGKRKFYEGQPYDEFTGIPFAAPPVGELRWKKPQPIQPWAPLLYEAKKFSVHCTQFISVLYPFIGMGSKTSEDCLYLNVLVPATAKNEKLPVMFWVFGGGYLLGTGEMYPGNVMALHGNVIVVTFNYRVSTLGWLSTGDKVLPGNYGLWDTQAALEWVYNHIEAFGGDKNLITVFGQSAGAAITSHTIISEQTNKMIKNAISFSGSSTGYFGTAAQPLGLAILLADVFNCSAKCTKDIETCLRDVDAKTLDFWGSTAQLVFEGRNPTLMPVVDNDFITQTPKESFLEGRGKRVNFMSGTMYDDAAIFIYQDPIALPVIGQNNSGSSNESLWKHMRQWYGFLDNTDEILNKIVDRYPSMDTTDSRVRGMTATKAFTEAWFGSYSNWEIGKHRSFGQGSSYQYQVRFRPTFLTGYPDSVNGTHMDELFSVFGPPFMQIYRKLILGKDFQEADYKLSDYFMSYITNFAHTSDPNQGPNKVPINWPVYNDVEKTFLQLSDNPHLESFYTDETSDRYQFHIDLTNDYVFPTPPSLPENNQTARKSEKEIQRAADTVREYLHSLTKNTDYTKKINDMIDHFIEDRKRFIETKSSRK